MPFWWLIILYVLPIASHTTTYDQSGNTITSASL